MLHNSRVECFLVLDLQVLRVLQYGKREADKAGRHKKLVIRPAHYKKGFYQSCSSAWTGYVSIAAYELKAGIKICSAENRNCVHHEDFRTILG
jgi:hypothetical protein